MLGLNLRATLIPFAGISQTAFTLLPPIYRNITHRELRPRFRRMFAVGELHESIKLECGRRRGGYSSKLEQTMVSYFKIPAYLERLRLEKFIGRGRFAAECVRNRPGGIVEHCALVRSGFHGFLCRDPIHQPYVF